ncbi:hypothetical protein ARAM_001471 [Aspergillus rambellii]|uniref:DUF7029 domain-containing protein n=1 Tax=Aspergillus rambellii TaxID=308745 RepID=A0A0F8V7N2_9EURO|nr:hypothetical protein ARAM_001471 [Aspergillus rambellii]
MTSPMMKVLAATVAVSSALVSAHPALHPAIRRDSTSADIKPTSEISLYYQSVNSSSLGALVQADLQIPSVVLENIQDLSSVVCSTESVTITFNSTTAYDQSYSTWPHSDLLLVTNHLGNCDAEAERGLYQVSSLAFDNRTLTITASTTETNLQTQAKNVAIAFGSSLASGSRKRDLTASVDLDWSGDLINTTALKIHASEASLDATVDISGYIQFNLLALTASKLEIDIALDLAAALNLTVSATGSLSKNLYSYTWSPISVSPFTIPGILSIGPILDVDVGVDFGIGGSADIVGNMSVSSSGLVHLDLLNATGSSVSGLSPKATASATISALADVDLDPFVGAEAAVGITLFNGLLDLSSGVKAKATVANVFTVDADVGITEPGNVTLISGTGSCSNGYWFTSDFVFNATAFVTEFYSVDLYSMDAPIYSTSCMLF